ncbi:MAG: NAD(P)H-dependent oxidoreductase [Chlorobiaceae bacterium]
MNNISKSVPVLSSTPRKGGNSDLLCDRFVSGAKESGHQVEKICPKDKAIRYCTGCGTCFNATKGCTQQDDMAEILDMMIAADVSSSHALQRTIEEFRGFTSCLEKPHEKGIIYGTGVWKIGDIRQSNAMGIAYEMGKTVELV